MLSNNVDKLKYNKSDGGSDSGNGHDTLVVDTEEDGLVLCEGQKKCKKCM